MKIPIKDIELDINNPRIKQWLEIYGNDISSEAIALALGAASGSATSSTYSALKESIKVNKGIINPIIVNKLNDSKFVVIEGNTRLQIYKEFLDADPEGPWKEICAVVHENLEDPKIHAIRLQSHLVGPREWDPFSKAKYLNQLSNIEKMPMAMIISFCGGKSSEIKKLIDAYSDMMGNYYYEAEEMGLEPNPKDFSKFVELQNASIVHALFAHKYTKKDFGNWVLDNNIDTAQGVRKLPAILSNAIAKEEFLKKNISEAVKHLNSKDKGNGDLSKALMSDLVTELIQRCRNVEFKYVKALKEDPRYDEEKLEIEELIDQLKSIIDFVEA